MGGLLCVCVCVWGGGGGGGGGGVKGYVAPLPPLKLLEGPAPLPSFPPLPTPMNIFFDIKGA